MSHVIANFSLYFPWKRGSGNETSASTNGGTRSPILAYSQDDFLLHNHPHVVSFPCGECSSFQSISCAVSNPVVVRHAAFLPKAITRWLAIRVGDRFNIISGLKRVRPPGTQHPVTQQTTSTEFPKRSANVVFLVNGWG